MVVLDQLFMFSYLADDNNQARNVLEPHMPVSCIGEIYEDCLAIYFVMVIYLVISLHELCT